MRLKCHSLTQTAALSMAHITDHSLEAVSFSSATANSYYSPHFNTTRVSTEPNS